MEKIKVVICENDKLARIEEIDADLKTYQDIVDGYIDAFYPFNDSVAVICNDEGKINGMKPNRAIYRNGKMVDVVFGTFFITGLTEDNFGSLTDEQATKYQSLFKYPEVIFKFNGKLVAVPLHPEDEE